MSVTGNIAILLTISLVLYGLLFFLLWRNINLSQPWKVIFCASVVPLFTMCMVLSVWMVNTRAPGLIDALNNAEQASGISLEPFFGFLIAVPFPLLVSALYFLVFYAIDGGFEKKPA